MTAFLWGVGLVGGPLAVLLAIQTWRVGRATKAVTAARESTAEQRAYTIQANAQLLTTAKEFASYKRRTEATDDVTQQQLDDAMDAVRKCGALDPGTALDVLRLAKQRLSEARQAFVDRDVPHSLPDDPA